MTSSDRATLDRLLPHFLDTIVITWLDGSVTGITGAWADDLPGPDGRPIHIITAAKLSVATSGLDRSEAVELGRRFDQLAIFELTAETQAVVSCIDTADPVEAPRKRWTLSGSDLTHAHLDRWWSAQTRAAALAGVDLPALRACPRCGSPHLARLLYGMPIGPPPPWIALGGCVVDLNQPRWRCTNCGTGA